MANTMDRVPGTPSDASAEYLRRNARPSLSAGPLLVQLPAYADDVLLPAFARRAAVRRAAIDRYFLSAGPTAANLQQPLSCKQNIFVFFQPR